MPAQQEITTDIVISIYDTTLPYIGDEGILDFAQKSSIEWIFEGGDDKFLPIMASRIEFDMEVSIEDSLQDLPYSYLFTGNEKRYAVVLTNQNDQILWRGFLMPEEYQEPYETGTFFIHFTATDGLGMLKGKKFSPSYYRARHSVIKAIADCLKLTNLDLEIYFSTSIINSLRQTWDKVFVNAQPFREGGGTNCYEILEDLLNIVGATLYQYQNHWQIQAWDSRGTDTTFRVYNSDGTFNRFSTLTAETVEPYFYEIPIIKIKPPFKGVTVTEGVPETFKLLPDDIVQQDWEMDASNQTAPPVRYWKNVGDGELLLYEPSKWDFDAYNNEDFKQQAILGYLAAAPSIPTIYEASQTPTHYIEMTRPIYVRGGEYYDFDLAWDMRIYLPGGEDITAYINKANMYDITLDGDVIISNRWYFSSRSDFKWEGNIYFSDDHYHLTAVVKIRKFLMPNNGFLNLKIICAGTNVSVLPVQKRFTTFSINYRDKIQSNFTKRRVIDYSATTELSLKNGSLILDEIPEVLYTQGIDKSEMRQIDVIYILNGKALVSISKFYEILANKDKFYVLRKNSDFFIYVEEFQTEELLLIKYIKPIFYDGEVLEDGDKLFIRPLTSGNPQNTVEHEAREKYLLKSNPVAEYRIGENLARLHHNLYPESLLIVEGDIKGIVQPYNIVPFEIKNQMRIFFPIRIKIKPNENTSSVTLIEYKYQNITDYGG